MPSDMSAGAAELDGSFVNQLTTTVWPKSRMLFAIVSKMSKEGSLNEVQRGVLKDLILEQDTRLMNSLAIYEQSGDRDKLYHSMRDIANQAHLNR